MVAQSVCLVTFVVTGAVGSAAPAPTSRVASDETAGTDSLRIARILAERGESSVEAFAIAARQLRAVDQGSDSDRFVERAFRTLSTVARLGGDVGTADVFARAAYQLALRQDFGLQTAETCLAYALATRFSGRPGARAATMSLIDETQTRLNSTADGNPRVRADLLQARANLARATHDPARVVDLYQRALDLRRANDHAHGLEVTDNECWLAWAHYSAGNLSAAKTLALHCQNDLRNLGLTEHPLMSAAFAQLATVSEARDDPLLAAAYYRSTLRISEVGQRYLFPGFSERRLSTGVRNALARLHLAEGDSLAAWRDFATGHRTLRGLSEALAWTRRFDPELAEKLRISATASAHLSGAVEAALRGLGSDSPASRESAVALLIRYAHRLSETLVLKDQLRKHGVTKGRDLPSLVELGSRLRSTQAVVGFLSATKPEGGGSPLPIPVNYAVILRSDGIPRWVKISSGATNPDLHALRREYSELMGHASEWPTRLPDDPRIRQLLHQLYAHYFAPIEPHLDGIREVLLLPSALWSGFPFPALVDDVGSTLVDRFSFRHLGGIGDVVFDHEREDPQNLASVVLGDPRFDPRAPTRNDVDPTLEQAISSYANTVIPHSVVNAVLEEGQLGLHELPRLQSSGWEARSIAAMTSPVTLLVRGEATEQNMNRACGGGVAHHYRWVHLATHALIHNSIPERSALALSPLEGEGLLHVEEIGFGWMLDADLVTLSGCQTGGGPVSRSEGPLGFLQALRAAGARNVLLSTAKVDDIATALLMERFYANLSNRASPRVVPSIGAPLSYSAALAEAQRWLRDLRGADGRQPFAHPVYWANFRLVGSGG